MCSQDPWMVSRIILSLVLIEALLSIDNAAVLAVMVRKLPVLEQPKALRYGLIGAYAFRGLAMLFAGLLIKVAWLKYLGGAYLIFIALKHFWGKYKTPDDISDDIPIEVEHNWFYKKLITVIPPFWATVALIELMDFTFSIDNVFAAVAFTPNLILICIGVFIGIIAMRFVAQSFIRLMELYPSLEATAFIVILILGIKLCLGVPTLFMDLPHYKHFIEGETLDSIISIGTLVIFAIPIIYTSLLKKIVRQ